MRRLARGALAAFLVAACATPVAESPPASTPSTTVVSAATVRASDARIDVALAGPSRVLYSPATMRVPRPFLRITVTNVSAAPLDVGDLRVRLDVTREGARRAVRCEEGQAEASRRRETRTLAPGASETFVRLVDCPLAVAGTYDVRVIVAFGRVEPFADGVVAKELALSVVAPPDAQPRPIAAVPGVYAAIGAGGIVPRAWGKGRIIVALVNERHERVALPEMFLGLRVRRVGTDIPCEDEPARLAFPDVIEPNAVLTRPVDVSCLGLGVTGTYDVEARVLVADTATPIGSLRLDVSADPSHVNRRILP